MVVVVVLPPEMPLTVTVTEADVEAPNVLSPEYCATMRFAPLAMAEPEAVKEATAVPVVPCGLKVALPSVVVFVWSTNVTVPVGVDVDVPLAGPTVAVSRVVPVLGMLFADAVSVVLLAVLPVAPELTVTVMGGEEADAANCDEPTYCAMIALPPFISAPPETEKDTVAVFELLGFRATDAIVVAGLVD